VTTAFVRCFKKRNAFKHVAVCCVHIDLEIT